MRTIPGWRIDPDGRASCERCGLVTRIADGDPLPVRHRCHGAARSRNGTDGTNRTDKSYPSHKSHSPEPALQLPPLARRAWNFAIAAAQHAAAGLPLCTQAEIDARLAICASCPLFNGSVCTHRDCGCPIGRDRRFWKKLAWADQACPLGKWEAAG